MYVCSHKINLKPTIYTVSKSKYIVKIDMSILTADITLQYILI